MSDGDRDRTALIGREKAAEVLAMRKVALEQRAAVLAVHPGKLDLRMQVSHIEGIIESSKFQTAGFLVAAGDSWFDYPIDDILKILEDYYGYNIESAAHRGDPIELMPYPEGQLEKLARCFERVQNHGAKPKAVLLSGGGDDIAGSEFGMLLNSADSDIAGWNEDIVKGVLEKRIVDAYHTFIHAINALTQNYTGKNLPILVHGYDYPVPDGRGFLGGWPFPGPWLQPGFHEKRFDKLSANIALLQKLIDKFNDVLISLSQDPAYSNVIYINLRGTLSNDLTADIYQKSWANELHPSKPGFVAIAAKFADALGHLL